MLRDPMGLPTWCDFSEGFEEEDREAEAGGRLGLSGLGFGAAPWNNKQDISSEVSHSLQTSPSQGASQSSYDVSSATSSSSTTLDTGDVPLSSYLMDGNVRAMLKKVTVNEGALNQAIQSLGGGEKGLKGLMGYIMSWVREHQHESSDTFSLSQKLENLQHKPPPSFAFIPTAPHPEATINTNDLPPQYYQPCTKSRRLVDGAVDRSSSSGAATFVNLTGNLPEELQYHQQKPQPTMRSYSSGFTPMMPPQGMHPQQAPNSSSVGLFSFAPGQEDLSRMLAATTTRAARRNRIARQRQHSLPSSSNRTTIPPTPAVSWATAPLSTPDSRSATADAFLAGAPPPAAAAVPSRKVNNADMLTFLLQKELRPSDVGNLGRIILPKKEAEMYLPILALREGIVLQMEDFDSGMCWNIRYRFWPNNKSRMYLLENTGEFVKQHRLQEGDLLILYRNQQGHYVLRGKKNSLLGSRGGAQRVQQKNAQRNAQKNAHSLARHIPEASKTEDVLKESDFDLGDWSCQKVGKERGFALELEDRKAMKVEPAILVGDDDPFFKEDELHNIGSSFGPGMLQPLERFPSLNLDFHWMKSLQACPKTTLKTSPSCSSQNVLEKWSEMEEH